MKSFIEFRVFIVIVALILCIRMKLRTYYRAIRESDTKQSLTSLFSSSSLRLYTFERLFPRIYLRIISLKIHVAI